MPSFFSGLFKGAFLKSFDCGFTASAKHCPWTFNEPTQPISRARLIAEIALIGSLCLIDRDCLCTDFGGNFIRDQ